MEDLRSAYRSRAKECHPDQGGAESHFVDLKGAYDVLSDPTRRAEYDRLLGLRELRGRPYRITKPCGIARLRQDLYDDIRDAIKDKLGTAIGGKIYLEVPAVEIHVNPDGIVLLSGELEITCPGCIGFGGWLGGCPRCSGSGRFMREYLWPFYAGSVLSKGDIVNFRYKSFEIHLAIV